MSYSGCLHPQFGPILLHVVPDLRLKEPLGVSPKMSLPRLQPSGSGISEDQLPQLLLVALQGLGRVQVELQLPLQQLCAQLGLGWSEEPERSSK